MADLNPDISDTLRVKLALENGNFVEDKLFYFTGQRTADNAVSPGFLNQLKLILEEITATIGNVDTGFIDGTLRKSIGTKVREIQQNLDDSIAGSIQGRYVSNMVGAGVYQDAGMEAGIYQVALSNIGVLVQGGTLPAEQTTPGGDIIVDSPVAIEGAVTTSFKKIYLAPGTMLARNISKHTVDYYKVFVQDNEPVVLDLDTTTAGDLTYAPAQVFDVDVAADYSSNRLHIRDGYQFPVFNGVMLGVFPQHAVLVFLDSSYIPTGDVLPVQSTAPGDRRFIFTYNSTDYTTYADLLTAMGSNPTPAMMRSVTTHIEIPTLPLQTKYIYVKYAYYPERWLGLAVAQNGLELIYKSIDGEVDTRYFASGVKNPLYDKFLPKPVGLAFQAQVRGSRIEGAIIHDIYVNPIQSQFTGTQNIYTERRVGRIQKALYRNSRNDSAFGGSLLAPADNLAISKPLGGVVSWSAAANWTVSNDDGATTHLVNNNPDGLAAQNQYAIDLGIYFTRDHEVSSRNTEVAAAATTFISDGGSTFSFPVSDGAKICIRMMAGSTSTDLTTNLRLRAQSITFSNGTTINNVDLYLPTTAEVKAYCGFLPTSIYVYYAYRDGITQGYLDSEFQHPFRLVTSLPVNPDPLEGTGIKHDHVAYNQIEGSRTSEATVVGDATLSSAINRTTGPTVLQTAAGTGKVRHIQPFSIGSIELTDEALAERHFPGSSVVGGSDATERVRGNVVLKEASVTTTELQRDPQVAGALTAATIKMSSSVQTADKTLATVLYEQLGNRATPAAWGTDGDNVDLITIPAGPQNSNPAADPVGAVSATWPAIPLTDRFDGLSGTAQIGAIDAPSRKKLIDTVNYLVQRIKQLEDNIVVKKDDAVFYYKDPVRNKHISLNQAMVPIGSIVDHLLGTFDAGQTTWTELYGGSISSWLAANSPNWVLCNGSLVSDAESILNGGYLPNLTDQRFTMGATTADNGGSIRRVGTYAGQNVLNNHSHAASSVSTTSVTAGRGYLSDAVWLGASNSNHDGYYKFVISGSFNSGLRGVNKYTDDNLGIGHSAPGVIVSTSTTVGAGSDPSSGTLENRPQFLSVYKIMRIK